ncbi:MAG: VWA domain-containing protein [Acidobacteria bacterium]|nr:VWA domain-containing protein [Acidobacteriota bacterium]MCB9378972.1 VWA domain-containing protein [Holophagales bacterium]
MKRTTLMLCGTLMLTAALAAGAQEGAGSQPAAEVPVAPPVFGETVEVRVVNLEVVVTDRDGLPITGLQAGDFRLTVDGDEVPIRYFTEVRGGDAVEVEAPEAGAAVAAVPDLVPGSPVGTSYLVFVDDFFSIGRDRDQVLRGIVKELARLGPEDRMAVVAFDGNRLELISSWSQSARELERALHRAESRPALGLQRRADKRNLASDQRLRRELGSPSPGGLDGQLDVTQRWYADLLQTQIKNAVSAAAAALRGFANPPGRKVMLLLSGGWPYDPAEFAANDYTRLIVEPGLKRGDVLLAPLVDTANQLGYTIYGVDVPGLENEVFGDAEFADAPDLVTGTSGFLRESNSQWSLEFLSQETGGRAMLNSRRLEVLQRAAADTRSYYWIGFVPDWQGDDARHAVEVEPLRKGLKVRSRAGYLDSSRTREVSMAVESVLLFGSGPNVQPLPIRVDEPKRKSVGVMSVGLELGIPLDGLTLVPTANGVSTDLELRVAALDERGGRSEIPVVPIRLDLPSPPPSGKYVAYRTTLELRRVRNQVVVALYDPVSGVIYSASVEIEP